MIGSPVAEVCGSRLHCADLFRRHYMKRSLASGALLLALAAAAPVYAQSKAKAENVPIIPHTSVANFFKLPPDLYFGEGIGIATNSKGHVFVYHRSGDTRLFE